MILPAAILPEPGWPNAPRSLPGFNRQTLLRRPDVTTRTRTDQYQARWAKTEAKLREALERLTNSQPTHPELLQKRRLRFDVSELALEAGVSRNAIYSSHPSFLDQLKALKTAREPLPGRLATTHDKSRN